MPMSREELRELYLSMVQDCEGDLLLVEISESKRLQKLYEERLQCLVERDPRLALVGRRAAYLYDHYEAHFRWKVESFKECVLVATEVLEGVRSQLVIQNLGREK